MPGSTVGVPLKATHRGSLLACRVVALYGGTTMPTHAANSTAARVLEAIRSSNRLSARFTLAGGPPSNSFRGGGRRSSISFMQVARCRNDC